jgi:glycosyltransferase involved in cell wall biosynthesis
MLKVLIDTGPKDSGHKLRGIGMHTAELAQALEGFSDKDIEISGRNLLDLSSKQLADFDIVHYTSFSPFFFTLPSRKPARKMVVTIHDLIPLIYPKHYPPGVRGSLKFALQKRRLKNADAIITISETSKKDICRLFKIPPRKVHVVYLAAKDIYRKIDAGSWQKTMREKYNLPKRFVLYVGDVNYNKNIPGLVEACKIAKIKLVIAGKNALNLEDLVSSGHAEYAHLSRVVNQLGRALRLGFVPDDDLVKIYNLASVYCQPSFYEGFGLPVLEAMACGTPVVVSKIQVHKEIADGAAQFADPKDPEKLAGAIEKVLGSPELSSQLVNTANVLVKKFTWKQTAEETLKVYKSL